MGDASVGITIPEELIRDLVGVEIARALGSREELVKAVVAKALSEKDPRGYRGETIFGKQVSEMIRAEAKRVFSEWLEKHRAKLREAFLAELNKAKGAKLRKLVESLVDNLRGWNLHVTLKEEDT
jgi:metal-responsive CopG/Arc/MetJ family transcriptional regulator